MAEFIDQTRAGAQIVATVVPCSTGIKDLVSAYLAVDRMARVADSVLVLVQSARMKLGIGAASFASTLSRP